MNELIKAQKHTAYSLEFNSVLEGHAEYNRGIKVTLGGIVLHLKSSWGFVKMTLDEVFMTLCLTSRIIRALFYCVAIGGSPAKIISNCKIGKTGNVRILLDWGIYSAYN